MTKTRPHVPNGRAGRSRELDVEVQNGSKDADERRR